MALCIPGIITSLIKIPARLFLKLGVDEFVVLVAADIFSVRRSKATKKIFVDSISVKTKEKEK